MAIRRSASVDRVETPEPAVNEESFVLPESSHVVIASLYGSLRGRCVIVFITEIVWYPLRGNHQCVCDLYEIYNTNFYYHQHVSNSIIVYCKHLTHARTNGRTHTHACARTRANACTPPHTSTPPSLYCYSMPANRDGPLRW